MDDELFNLQGMIIILKASARQLNYFDLLIDDIVDLASDGHKALEMVKDRYFKKNMRYDLIITDI